MNYTIKEKSGNAKFTLPEQMRDCWKETFLLQLTFLFYSIQNLRHRRVVEQQIYRYEQKTGGENQVDFAGEHNLKLLFGNLSNSPYTLNLAFCFNFSQ